MELQTEVTIILIFKLILMDWSLKSWCKQKSGATNCCYNTTFSNCSHIYFYWDIYFFTWLCVTIHCPFIFSCRTPLIFVFFYRGGLVVKNSLSFSLSRNVLIFPSLLDNSFAGNRILGRQVCFFLLALWLYDPLSSDFQSFWWEIFWKSYWWSPVCD